MKITELFEIERAKKGKIYPKDSILLQVSATKGQLVFLEEEGPADSKYAVLIPKTKMHGRYLYYAVSEYLPAFLFTRQTGLNIKPEILQDFEITIATDYVTQKAYAEILQKLDQMHEKELQMVAELRQVKQFHLNKMFL